MKARTLTTFAAVGFATCLVLGIPLGAQQPDQPPDGVEVLARGPVHEAYAEPTDPRGAPLPVVPKAPPDPVQELPPDQRPEGDDIEWIPGYWNYDEERSDFLWVSGFWRDAPPKHTWVPGSWQQVSTGWQWSPGFWANDAIQTVSYVPPPPEMLEAGPSVPAPQPDMQFVPGCWVYRETRYVWRPGFWTAFRPGWVWVPARYVWTPGGCIFIDGFWDYPLHLRGLLFAPVRFAPTVVVQRNFSYVPRYVVRHDFLISALFVRSTNRHYYFGDYFDNRYSQRGFVPWVDYRVGRQGFDHNLAYYSHRFGRDDHFVQNLRQVYVGRQQGSIPRPPQTLVQQTQVVNNIVNKTQNVTKNVNITNVQNVTVLAPITQINNTRLTNFAALANVDNSRTTNVQRRDVDVDQRTIKLAAVSREEQAAKVQRAQQVRELAQQRRQVEQKLQTARTETGSPDAVKAAKLELPKELRRPATDIRPAGSNVTTRQTPPPLPNGPQPKERPDAPTRPAEPRKADVPPTAPRTNPPPVVMPKKDNLPPATPKKDNPPVVTPKKDVPPPVVTPKKDVPPPAPKKDVPPPAPKKNETPRKKDAPATSTGIVPASSAPGNEAIAPPSERPAPARLPGTAPPPPQTTPRVDETPLPRDRDPQPLRPRPEERPTVVPPRDRTPRTTPLDNDPPPALPPRERFPLGSTRPGDVAPPATPRDLPPRVPSNHDETRSPVPPRERVPMSAPRGSDVTPSLTQPTAPRDRPPTTPAPSNPPPAPGMPPRPTVPSDRDDGNSRVPPRERVPLASPRPGDVTPPLSQPIPGRDLVPVPPARNDRIPDGTSRPSEIPPRDRVPLVAPRPTDQPPAVRPRETPTKDRPPQAAPRPDPRQKAPPAERDRKDRDNERKGK